MNIGIFLCACAIFHWIEVSASEPYNVTKEWNPNHRRNRQKRFLIWEHGGIFKLVVGIAYPVNLGDKKPWRALNCNYNFQAQFAVPQKPTYWWDKWDGRSLADAKLQYNKDGTYHSDESRRFIYALLELYADRRSKNGKQCLLRAICENGGVDDVEGIYAELLQVVLTKMFRIPISNLWNFFYQYSPGDDADEEYRNAYKAGRYGAVCTSLYPDCPHGQGLFDDIFVTQTTNYVGKTK